MRNTLMNKVFSCDDDCSISIYYQDTDIAHLKYDDVDKLVEYLKENITKSW